MLVEVKGVNFDNQGAGMMMLAVQERLGARHDFAAVANDDYAQRAPFGVRQLLRKAGPVPLGPFTARVPARLRRRVGLVLDREIGAVLDASGFAHGDQWGAAKTRERLFAALDRRRKAGVPVVLLPQALGPFDQPDVRDAFARVVDEADLIFIRDAVSARYVNEAFGERPNLRRSPDFTIGLGGLADARHAGLAGRPAIVPNHMVVRGAGASERSHYLDLLAAGVTAATRHFGAPFIALHDAVQDAPVADALIERTGPIERVSELRPRVMKALLGRSAIVIGSRFHALIAALAHGTPVVAFGWSHKYAELLADFGCSESLLRTGESSPADVTALVDRIAAEHDERRNRLKAAATRLTGQVDAMWNAVETVLEGAR